VSWFLLYGKIKIDSLLYFSYQTMTTALLIPFHDIIQRAFVLREKNPELSVDELVKQILPTIQLSIQSEVPINLRKDVQEPAPVKKELAPEDRCMARTIYELIHLEDGKLKIMRDDNKNLYGDRCKCRKKENGQFCTRHSGWQSLGVWNGEYSGKFQEYVSKTVCQIVDDDEPPKKKKETFAKKEPVKKERMVKPATIVDGNQSNAVKPAIKAQEEVEHNDQPKEEEDVEHNDQPKEEESDEDSVVAYPITIDGMEYNIDETNHVWTDDGDLLGVYDRIKKKWVSKL